MYIPRFIYNDGSEAGAGGTDAIIVNTPAAPEVPLITLDELKGYGFNSPDELKTFLTKQKEENIDPQEKINQANREKADFLKFSADNTLLAVEEYSTLESLRGRKDVEIVRDEFTKSYREDNSDADDEEVAAAFDTQYPLQSENVAQKKWAEKQIAKEAKEIRSPLESKFEVAQKDFKDYQTLNSKIPGFNKFIDGVIDANTPEKLSFHKVKDGETEIHIEAELTADQRKELKDEVGKMFRNPKTYNEYAHSESKEKELNDKIAKKINGYIKINYFEKAIEKGFEAGKGLGVTKGSTVGAEQPFAIVRNMNVPGAEGKINAAQEVQENDLALRRQLRK